VIADLLPPGVASVEAVRDDPAGPPLFPEEEAVISRAVEKRRREFTTVRRCAREALTTLGVPPAPLLPGRRGAPAWPSGVRGSMTHCAGYRAAAVAPEDVVAAIGIDAEPNAALPPGVLDSIATHAERAWIRRRAAAEPDVCWGRLLFSAKESVFKAWYPRTERELDFDEAELEVDASGTFTARVLVGPCTTYSGRWSVGDGLILTAVAQPL
jgi:4'-phosphopantetheinyl transferase EntD